ncbi:hypothetical protein ICL16_34300 [Iningainema sp. BLCCT55]|uniref:Uncharacterized protein n=1 Tax=Iningainema tapete BLCC-T55 TaxID=2748662 RepID=A0A8J6XRH1_9CYAN|nr:hypothetical protein [Iningainema tapete]MBD2776989.1 hypothetical protein [Iningainema tapete BLCC-T55]
MSRQLNHANNVCLLLLIAILITNISTVSAHKVTIATDVGATLHIEPNDNPRAGEPAQAWFALTRKGGKVIPLAECKCELSVYKEPHKQGAPPLLVPSLKPMTAERYQNIPGAEVTFPQPGAYQLKLSGKPVTQGSFQPFELKFAVTVAAGVPVSSSSSKNKVETIEKKALHPEKSSLFWNITALASAFTLMGISLFVLQRLKRE